MRVISTRIILTTAINAQQRVKPLDLTLIIIVLLVSC